MGEFRLQARDKFEKSVIDYIYHLQAYTLKLSKCNSDMFDYHNSMISLIIKKCKETLSISNGATLKQLLVIRITFLDMPPF